MLVTYIANILILILVSLLESTWLSSFFILGARPDFSLVVLAYISFHNVSAQGVVSGFASGLIIDGISLAPWGYTSFIRTVIAWIYSVFSGKLIIDRVFLPMLMGFIATLLKLILMLLVFFIFKQPTSINLVVNMKTLVELGLNTLMAPILFFILSLLKRFLVYIPGNEK